MDNESISGDPQHNTPSNGGVSRRSLMKAGAHAAWAIPMVQVVAAAPAIAVSQAPVLSFGTLTANYGQSPNPSSAADPTHLFITAVVNNSGGAANSLQATLIIPANRYDKAPQVTTISSGWTAATPSGSLAQGWSIVFAVTAQFINGSTPTLTVCLTLDDTLNTRKFDGTSFLLAGALTAANTGTSSTGKSASVPATPNASLEVKGFATGVSYPNGNTLRVTGTTIAPTGTSSVGPVQLTITIPSGSKGLSSAPTVPSTLSTGWSRTTAQPSGAGPWKYTFEHPKLEPSKPTSTFSADFALTGNGKPSTTSVFTADATGVHADPAVTVSATA